MPPPIAKPRALSLAQCSEKEPIAKICCVSDLLKQVVGERGGGVESLVFMYLYKYYCCI